LRAADTFARCLGRLGRWADEASITEFIQEVETESVDQLPRKHSSC
jgi:hypothetical protein